MPNLDFLVHDDEWAYEGACHYSIRKGDKGDRVTAPIADAVDDVTVLRVDAYGWVINGKVTLRESLAPSMSQHMKGKLMRSRLLMERLEEQCQEDLDRGSDAN